jgi:hypothetical protein
MCAASGGTCRQVRGGEGVRGGAVQQSEAVQRAGAAVLLRSIVANQVFCQFGLAACQLLPVMCSGRVRALWLTVSARACVRSWEQSEAETLQQLKHPHIVEFYGCVKTRDFLYFVLEYVLC